MSNFDFMESKLIQYTDDKHVLLGQVLKAKLMEMMKEKWKGTVLLKIECDDKTFLNLKIPVDSITIDTFKIFICGYQF